MPFLCAVSLYTITALYILQGNQGMIKMSSYIVENETIDRIISTMENTKIIHEWIDDKTTFGQKLIDMNISAVDQRYSETNDPIKYTYNRRLVSNVQGLKSLHYFLYQCMEGDVPESDLYIKMRRVSDCLAQTIIQKLPSYDKAEWA